MVKNPVITAILGLLVGFMVGYVVGQGTPRPAAPAVAPDPHAGVPGAPALGQGAAPPPEGRPAAPAVNPRLRQQLRELEGLLAKEPDNYQHLVQLGNVYYDLGDFLKAIDAYERARTRRDDSADVLTDLGVCYREVNQPEKALELFRRAASVDPRHWQSRYNAAVVCLFDLGRAEDARRELEQLKALAAENPQVPDLAGLEAEIAKRL